MSQEVLLSVKDLRTEFFSSKTSSVTAIKDVSFDMYRGEVLGLVGESGCGKSVTSLSIMQLLKDTPGKVTNGSATLDGVNLVEASDAQIRDIRGGKMSMIFQEPMSALNPSMRIDKQMIETIRLHQDMTKEQALAHAADMLKKVGIPDPARVLKNYPHQLSGGMRQRVVIAIALSCDPEVLICDEPTTALDVTIQAKILELIKDIQEKKDLSVIYITHDLGVVAKVADFVNVMYAGRIIETGTVNDIFYDPKHPYTWGLLASMPDIDSKEDELYTIPGTPPNLLYDIEGDAFAPRNRFALKIDEKVAPPMFKISDTHQAATWLAAPKAPKVEMPKDLKRRIARMKKEAGL